MPKTQSTPLLGTFLKISGFDKDDIMSWNDERRIFVSWSGSKYRLDEDNKSVQILSGERMPNLPDQAALAEMTP